VHSAPPVDLQQTATGPQWAGHTRTRSVGRWWRPGRPPATAPATGAPWRRNAGGPRWTVANGGTHACVQRSSQWHSVGM